MAQAIGKKLQGFEVGMPSFVFDIVRLFVVYLIALGALNLLKFIPAMPDWTNTWQELAAAWVLVFTGYSGVRFYPVRVFEVSEVEQRRAA